MSWMDEVNDLEENDINGGGNFAPIPDGWYEVLTSEAAEKQNKANAGHHLSLKMQITSEPCNGRLHWENYNIDNPSETVQKIGRGQLKRMMLAAGIDKISDLSELNDLCFFVKFGRDKKDDSRNVVKAYRSLKDGAGADDEADAQKAEEKPSAKKSAPWKK